MARQRVPGYITTEKSNGFGIDVQVNRQPLPQVGHPPSGTERGTAQREPVFTGYREVIPPGKFGSEEGVDRQLPPPTYVDTVPSYPTEQNDVRLHGPMAALRAADTQSIPLQAYGSFQPRTAPLPRNVSDELYLRGYGENVADPRMSDRDSATMLIPKDSPDRCDLYGRNRDGVLHNPVGSFPQPPTSPTTNAAAAQSTNRQAGRGNTRTPHGRRPPELADQPMSTKRIGIDKSK